MTREEMVTVLVFMAAIVIICLGLMATFLISVSCPRGFVHYGANSTSGCFAPKDLPSAGDTTK